VTILVKINLKQERVFWFMVSSFSVHGCLAPLLSACDEAEYHGGKQVMEQSCTLNGSQEAKREERNSRVPISPLQAHTPNRASSIH
jgi:hypothetical protein